MNKPWLYLDTSAYLKLFVHESGSTRVRKIILQNNVLSSAILSLECCSAISRRRQAGEIQSKEFEKLLAEIREGLLSVEIVRVTDEVLQGAEEVALRSNVRALDAVHISSALLFQDATMIRLTFMTSDKKQHEAALRERLTTIFVE
jgi:predicted nucleic acid-binding protein